MLFINGATVITVFACVVNIHVAASLDPAVPAHANSSNNGTAYLVPCSGLHGLTSLR